VLDPWNAWESRLVGSEESAAQNWGDERGGVSRTIKGFALGSGAGDENHRNVETWPRLGSLVARSSGTEKLGGGAREKLEPL